MLKYIALEIKTNKISFINIAHNIINHLPFVQNETRVLFHVYNYTQTSTIIALSTPLDAIRHTSSKHTLLYKLKVTACVIDLNAILMNMFVHGRN